MGEVASGRYVFVTAPAGFGKSALLVAWLRRLEANGQEPAYAFINRLPGTADEAVTLKALCQQLLSEEDRVLEISSDAAGLRARFGELLRSRPTSEPSVVVIDGLDEADWQLSGLPSALPAGRLIVLSARATGADWVGELSVDRAIVTTIALETLGAREIARLLRRWRAGRVIRRERGVRARAPRGVDLRGQTRAPGGDPLYVRLLVEDVREGRIASVADLALQPAGLGKYFDQWRREITEALSGRTLRELLGYLLVAHGPIGRSDLAAIRPDDALDEWGDGDKVPPIDDVLARVERFLIGDDQGRALGQPRFEAYLTDQRVDEAALEHYRTTLRDYCSRLAEQPRPSRYALTHYADHLREDGLSEALRPGPR